MSRTCLHCGREFEGGRSDKVYCSYECRKYASVQRRYERSVPLRSIECPVCGKGFDARDRRVKYCSHSCYVQGHRQKVRENNRTKSQARQPVVCIETGQLFRSQRSVFEHFGVAGSSQLGTALNYGCTYKGYHWRRA